MAAARQKNKNTPRQEKPLGDEYAAIGGAPSLSASVRAPTEMSWRAFDAEVQQLARSIARHFKPEVVVGLAHGGVFVGASLAAVLGLPFYGVHILKRSRDRSSHLPSGISKNMPKDIKGRRVLIVDDIASSGDNFKLAMQRARLRGTKALATVALVTRPGGFATDFYAFSNDAVYVFPWDYQTLVDEARFARMENLK